MSIFDCIARVNQYQEILDSLLAKAVPYYDGVRVDISPHDFTRLMSLYDSEAVAEIARKKFTVKEEENLLRFFGTFAYKSMSFDELKKTVAKLATIKKVPDEVRVLMEQKYERKMTNHVK